jgi:hypothetical protein
MHCIKPTNKQLYIHKTSYHPKSVKTAIPKGETLRYLRTNTQEATFKNMTEKLKDKLIERGYRAKEINQILREYPFENHTELITKEHEKSKAPPPVLPVKYSQVCEEIRKIIRKYWPDIEGDPSLNEIFPDKPMIAYKKNKTIANRVVRSKVTGNEPNRPLLFSRPPRINPTLRVCTNIRTLLPRSFPVSKCRNPRCTNCPRMLIAHSIYNRKLSYHNYSTTTQITPANLYIKKSGICNQMQGPPQSLCRPNNKAH